MDNYGFVGLFIAAFINNYIPGLPPFYLTLVSAYAAAGSAEWYVSVASAGLGAGLGKVALFTSAGAVASKLSRGRMMRRYASRLLGGGKAKISITLLVFLAASLPLPDDIIYIPLGAAAFSMSYFAAAVITGKILLVSGFYALGSISRKLLEASGGLDTPTAIALILASLAASIAVTLLMLNLDWEKIYLAYTERGGKEAFKELISELRSMASKILLIKA